MSIFDDTGNTISGAAAWTAFGVGTAYAGKKAWPEIRSLFRGGGILPSPGLGLTPYIHQGAAPTANQYLAELERAAETGLAVMGPSGWREAVTKAVHASMLRSGKATHAEMETILTDLGRTDPRSLLGKLQGLEAETGGLGAVHSSLRGLLLGKTPGRGSETLAGRINTLGATFPKSYFSPGSVYWDRLFGGAADALVEGGTLKNLASLGVKGAPQPAVHAMKLQKALRGLFEGSGVDVMVTAGTRDLTATGHDLFHAGKGYQFARIGGEGKPMQLPYAELQIRVGKETSYIPLQYSTNQLTPFGHGKMSMAATGRFTIAEKAGGVRQVEFNEALSLALYGDEGGFDNLATRIYKGVQERKSLRAVSEDFNALVRAQVREFTVLPHARAGSWMSSTVHSTAGARALASIYATSVVPIERAFGAQEMLGSQDLVKYAQQLEGAGLGGWPLASPQATFGGMRFMTRPLHSAWSIFGSSFLLERRALQHIRDFEPTEAAVSAMVKSPILGGLIPRNIPVAATDEYIRRVAGAGYQMPSLVMAYARGEAAGIRQEEVLVSKALAEMMETQTIKTYTLHAPFGGPREGTELTRGMPIGVETKSGRMVYGQGIPGQMAEEVIASERFGDILRVAVARRFPLQEQAKTFEMKATLRLEADIGAAATREWGLHGQEMAKLGVEALGHIDLLKKNPALLQGQMLGGLLHLGGQEYQRRLGLGLHIPSTMAKVFAGGRYAKEGRAFIRERLKEAPEREILALAKDWRLAPEEIGAIGMAYHQKLAAGSTAKEIQTLYTAAGLVREDIRAIERAPYAIGLPTFYLGDYPAHTAWERGTIEPRGMKELLAADWKAGDKNVGRMIAEEIERRRIPEQTLSEIETSLVSMVGEGVPTGKKVVPAAQAADLLRAGETGFVMELPSAVEGIVGKQIYVPTAQQLGWFVPEVGQEMPQTLLANYLKVAGAADRYASGQEEALGSMANAAKRLRDATFKQFLIASQARGQVAGTTAPVLQSWIGEAKHYETLEEALAAPTLHRAAIGYQEAQGMFEDMMMAAPKEERAAIQESMERFLAGGATQKGMLWRHPLVYPYSMMPVEYSLAQGQATGVFLPKVTYGPEKIDISGMHGMAADVDMDRGVTMFITDKQVEGGLDVLMNDRRSRTQYIEAMRAQVELEEASKASLGPLTAYSKEEAIQRLVGIEAATPEVSIAMQRLKAAAAETKSPIDRIMMATFFARMEQGAIGAKHGGQAEALAHAVSSFVGYKGAESPQALDKFTKAFTGLYGAEEFTTKSGRRWNLKEQFQIMSSLLRQSEASGGTAAFEKLTRMQSKASKGGEVAFETAEEIMEAVKMHRAGLGQPESALLRRMAMGPPSGVEMARTGLAQTVAKLKAAGNIAKKYWKGPAAGLAVGIGLRYALGGGDLEMPDASHEQAATALAMGAPPPQIPPPPMMPNRAVVNSGGYLPSGYEVNLSGDFGQEGVRDLISEIGNMGGGPVDLRMTDNRQGISPDRIRKMMDENY